MMGLSEHLLCIDHVDDDDDDFLEYDIEYSEYYESVGYLHPLLQILCAEYF